jgi:hypothetical protein
MTLGISHSPKGRAVVLLEPHSPKGQAVVLLESLAWGEQELLCYFIRLRASRTHVYASVNELYDSPSSIARRVVRRAILA